MTVEETLRYNLLAFPGLFPIGLEVFNHLFLTNGNGYSWENGELIDVVARVNPIPIQEVKDAVLYRIHSMLDPGSAAGAVLYKLAEKSGSTTAIKNMVGELQDQVRLLFEVEERIKSFDLDYKFDELTKYSRLCSLPDDIKDDWLNAAEKMYNLLIERGCTEEEKLLTKVGERIKELRRLRVE